MYKHTFSSTATFLMFHKNSMMPSKNEAKHPNTNTTNTPPTFPIPNSAASAEASLESDAQLPVNFINRNFSLLFIIYESAV